MNLRHPSQRRAHSRATEEMRAKLLVELGTRMYQARIRAAISLDELAARIGCRGHGRLGEYEAGALLPRVEKLAKIAQALGVSTDWLLGIKEDRQ